MSEATRRESPATRREDDAPGPVPPARAGTRLEGDPSRGHRVNLPPSLATRFEIVDLLPSGSQADVLLVKPWGSTDESTFRVVKLYRHGKFDQLALSAIDKAMSDRIFIERARVVRIEEVDSEPGYPRWELMEWCRFGSLDKLAPDQLPLIDLIRQLSEALTALHTMRGKPILHLDVKPRNVLVRSVSPLDLAITDFGIARLQDGTRLHTQNLKGTDVYAPPEHSLSTARDWWALGMMVAELAMGRHPLMINGEFPPLSLIHDQLARGPVVLSIADERVLLLCRGLLHRDCDCRWTGVQVAAWLNGQTPAVEADGGSRALRTRTVAFAGTVATTPAELASVLQANWTDARRGLLQGADTRLVAEVRAFLQAEELTEAQAVLEQRSPNASAVDLDRQFAALLIELNPQLEPIFDGRDVRVQPLVALLSADPPVGVKLVRDVIVPTSLLLLWRDARGMVEAVRIDDRLKQATRWLSEQGRGRDLPAVQARVYQMAITGQTDSGTVPARDRALAARQSWWAQLDQSTSPYDRLVAVVLAGEAAEETTRADIAGVRVSLTKKRDALPARRFHPGGVLGVVGATYAIACAALAIAHAQRPAVAPNRTSADAQWIGLGAGLVIWLLIAGNRARRVTRRHALTRRLLEAVPTGAGSASADRRLVLIAAALIPYAAATAYEWFRWSVYRPHPFLQQPAGWLPINEDLIPGVPRYTLVVVGLVTLGTLRAGGLSRLFRLLGAVAVALAFPFEWAFDSPDKESLAVAALGALVPAVLLLISARPKYRH